MQIGQNHMYTAACLRRYCLIQVGEELTDLRIIDFKQRDICSYEGLNQRTFEVLFQIWYEHINCRLFAAYSGRIAEP